VIDAETAEAFRESLRHAFRHDAVDALGAVAAVDAALAHVGWLEALAEAGLAVVPLLFGEQGAANATSTALDDLLTAALGLATDPGTAFVLPAFAGLAAPGTATGSVVGVAGLGTSRMTTAEAAVVVADGEAGLRVAVVPAGRLRTRPIAGLDPRLGLVAVEGDVAGVDWLAAAPGWVQALALGQVALAHELLGASRTMLRLACEHATTRVQFGRPIGQFQAVRHRLADSLIAIESAEAVAGAAGESAGGTAPGHVSPQLAAIAKGFAGRNARTVARHCQQVLAGVGFTAEHDFHRYFRRVVTLDGLLGTTRTLTKALGEELLTTREIPLGLPL
jgi:hypothetical protein